MIRERNKQTNKGEEKEKRRVFKVSQLNKGKKGNENAQKRLFYFSCSSSPSSKPLSLSPSLEETIIVRKES